MPATIELPAAVFKSCDVPGSDNPVGAIERFCPSQAGRREFLAFADLRNRSRAEELPDDPPIPVAEYVRRLQSVSPAIERSIWVIWNSDQTAIIASGALDQTLSGESRKSANLRIAVIPEFRRRGIASRLLAVIAEVAERANSPLLQAHTSGRIPAGEAFMTSLGASQGLESRVHQLDLAELEPGIVRGWVDSAARRAAGFDLLFWLGIYPEEHIEAIAALHNVINHQPRGSLEVNDIHFTPSHVRSMEHQALVNGAQRWSLYARETATGKLAGFTQVYWHPNRPALLQQSFTGVFPEFRNRGLGRWLKAAMLEKIMSDRRQVRFVRTDNANVNAAMLRVNQFFGFKNYSSSCLWQVETRRVVEYLATRSDPDRSPVSFDLGNGEGRTTVI
jgi:mycothiol synthase